MGHSDPTVTMAIYSHLAKEKEDESADLVRNAISGKVAKKLPKSKQVRYATKYESPKP